MRALAAAVALVLIVPAGLRAQVGATTDIITGVVTGPDSAPVPGAQVQVISLESEVARTRTTDARGRFTILFPDGGGQYRLVVRYIGMAPATLAIARQADEDRLVANVQLQPAALTLEAVEVRARPNRGRGAETAGPGGTQRVLTAEQLERLPIDAADLNLVATLAPGVVGLAATDSTEAAFSVAGQRPTANNVTLDGLSYGSGSVPQDAIRTTRIVTNTYDVARGQFSGGLVAATTRSGTNEPQAAFTYNLRDRALAWGAADRSAFGQGATQNQLGGGIGGPLVPNRLFVFGSLQGRWNNQPLTALTSADAAVLERYGVNADSANRFLALVDSSGLPFPAVSADRATDNAVGLMRLDWIASDAHTLTLRLDGRRSTQDPTRVGALALPQTGGTRTQTGGGAYAGLTSYLGGRFINDAKLYISGSRSRSDAYLDLPEGRVQVASGLGDGARGVATLAFGGNPSLPQRQDQSAVELSDELSLLAAGHRVKLGLWASGTRFTNDITANRYGTFTYQSLDGLAANEPIAFTRAIAPAPQRGTTENAAMYLGDTWRVVGGLQLAYGARLEGTRFRGVPALDRAVDSLFGLRTDRVPSETHVSPRVGFTWLAGGGGARRVARTIVRGGVGDFRSLVPGTLYASALGATGASGSETQLSCVGTAVPTPDWSMYAEDPGAIPGDCTDTATVVTVTPQPNVTVFDPTFGAPRTRRASLGVQQRVFTGYTVSLDASYARGVNQYGFRDVNLGPARFALPEEGGRGGRPVFVPLDSIGSAGEKDVIASRAYPGYGRVLVIGSDLQSESRQVTASIGGLTGHGAVFQLSYTWTRARDQSSFSCCAASQGFQSPTTGGDPNVREWATSDFERRHSILGTVTYPLPGSLELTAIARLTSGVPFTPLVGSDVNGDGARNDRAFVFDPAGTADTTVASAMRRLLAGAPDNVRSCLASQLGRVAGRNSCAGPWQGSLDFQLNYRPVGLGLDRRLTVSLSTVNLLGGLDELLHGSAGLRGWGLSGAPDPVLLYVRGFDAGVPAYSYAVNERFGARRSGTLGVVAPFQIAFQAHLALGPLPGGFGGFGRGGGGGGRGGGRGGGGADQVTRLQGISDTLDAALKVVGDSLHAVLERAGPNPEPGVVFGRLRPHLQEGRAKIEDAIAKARAVLTAEQWGKVPAAIRNPRRR